METLYSYFAHEAYKTPLGQIFFPITITNLIEYLKGSYFTDLLSCLMGVVAFYVFIKSKNGHKTLSPFKYYFLGYALPRLFSFVGMLLSIKLQYKLMIYFDFVFTNGEFLIFTIFFKRLFFQQKDQNLVKYLEKIFFAFNFFLFAQDLMKNGDLLNATVQNIFILQAVMLIIPCAMYYKNVFLGLPSLLLLREPGFWVITGLSFFMLCTLPFSLLANYIENTNIGNYGLLYSIFNIFYCFLFIMILKAQSCDSNLSTT